MSVSGPNDPSASSPPSRDQLVFSLSEAAELEHCVLCTYLYAAFSLKQGVEEGLTTQESEAVARWRRVLLDVAIEEMGHAVAVWNITSALGVAPRVGRMNFPLDPGYLPADIVLKLAPFNPQTLQHFIHLERPVGSTEPDGEGFAPEHRYLRGGAAGEWLTPMPLNFDTIGDFYAMVSAELERFVAAVGEAQAFCGDPALQISPTEVALEDAQRVVSLQTAADVCAAIVVQGEGAPDHAEGSHFQQFTAIRDEYAALLARNPAFTPAHPAATNPVLRRPPRPEGRVWLDGESAVATVDLANACYGLMLRLLAYAYCTPTGAEKSLCVDLAVGLMRAMTPLGERAARLPAGPSNPGVNAGLTFAMLRDTSALPAGPGAWQFFNERLSDFAEASARMAQDGDARTGAAARVLADLAKRAAHGAKLAATAPYRVNAPADNPPAPTESKTVAGVETVAGSALSLMFEAKRCIHARFCVTGAPNVFLANVKGPWLHPEAMDAERLVDIAHACPSGAIRYRRNDGRPNEAPPPVNLAAVREAGPYAFRGELLLDGKPAGCRATLCRCGASKNKPYCDGSHQAIGFTASGEPASGSAAALPMRNGPLQIDPQTDGPLQVRGNLEITSGTGRVVARVSSARLCRCGASANKPFCDNSHARVGFRSA